MSRPPGCPAEDPQPLPGGLGIVDLLLGEGSDTQRADLRREIAADPGLALEHAALSSLLEGCRELRAEPTGRVLRDLSLRARIRARRQQAPAPLMPWWGRLVGVGSVAAAALVLLVADPLGILARARPGPSGARGEPLPAYAVAGGGRVGNPMIELPPAPRPTAAGPLPVDEASFRTAYRNLASLAPPDAFDAYLRAANDLEMLGGEFHNRILPQRRRALLAATGGNPDVDDRIQELARFLARQTVDRLAAGGDGDLTVFDASMALRALLASGAGDPGRRIAVDRVTGWLESRLASLDGGELASALGGLCELAVGEGGDRMELVREHTGRLVTDTITRRSLAHAHRRARPGLLSFEVPVASLADAGRLLALAPAFGVSPDLAFEARKLVLAHLEERLQKAEQPGVLAAELYGFGDLIGRFELDRRLRMWQTVNLDEVTLFHLAWSRFPVRRGFASFQQDLRRLSARPNPETLREASARLLCLAMNFAAPGAGDLLSGQD